MECTYCQTKMQIANVRVKRPVPQGARDMGLYDEVVAWQCPNCHMTSDRGLSKCHCGSVTTNYDVPSLAIPLVRTSKCNGFLSETPEFTCCSDCTKCTICQQPLQTREYGEIKSEQTSGRYNTDGDYVQVPYQRDYSYFHKSCHERKIQEEKQIADVRRKEAEVQQCALAEQEKVKAQRRAVATQEQNRRIEAGLCTSCGKPLNFFDKLQGKRLHSKCIADKAKQSQNKFFLFFLSVGISCLVFACLLPAVNSVLKRPKSLSSVYVGSDSTGTSNTFDNSNPALGEYIAMTSQRKLTKDDLVGLSKSDLTLMRNAPYARHHYKFGEGQSSAPIFNYFHKQSWYVPKTSNAFVEIQTFHKLATAVEYRKII